MPRREQFYFNSSFGKALVIRVTSMASYRGFSKRNFLVSRKRLTLTISTVEMFVFLETPKILNCSPLSKDNKQHVFDVLRCTLGNICS